MLAALLHDVGMSIHRRDHEDWSLFLAEPKMRELLDGVYDEPELTVVVSEALQAITSHRADGEPLSLEAGVLRVADALDMAKGRSRIPFERGSVSIHSLSAAAIDEVRITDGETRPGHGRDRHEQLVRHLPGRRAAQGEAPRIGSRAVRRGRRTHRHRGREAPRPGVPARDRRAESAVADPVHSDPPLRGRLTAGRLALDQEVGVRIPAPQPRRSRWKQPRLFPDGRHAPAAASRDLKTAVVGQSAMGW